MGRGRGGAVSGAAGDVGGGGVAGRFAHPGAPDLDPSFGPMNDADVRALRRAALLLLTVSAARWAWQAREGGLTPGAAAGADTVAALLEESRVLAADARARSMPLAPGERLDPNRAAEEELDRLPGVGAATARALVASRERDGPFHTAADLGRVKGIGPATVARMEPFLEFAPTPGRTPVTARRPPDRAPAGVPARASRGLAGGTVGPGPRRSGAPAGAAAAPVDVNRADEAALQALPGVGPALAARIVAARSEAPFRSVDDLLRVRGIGPATLERLRPRVTTGGRGGG